MFKNALIYRIEHWAAPSLPEIESRLQQARFVECGPSQPESAGWVAPRGEAHAALIESVTGPWIVQLCTETKTVPGSVVKTQVQGQLDRIERDIGRRPRGKVVKALKEEVVHALLPRAFPKRVDTRVWVDAAAGLVWVGAGSTKKADAVVTRLLPALGGGLRVSLLQTALAPATAMAAWLTAQAAPAGFSIDRDCELKQPDAEKAAVRYARHALDIAEVAAHIQAGKQPTQLALTWRSRVSFVLTEALTLKRIQLLDVVLQQAGAGAAGDNGFDADAALSTGELRLLVVDLLAALGGLPPPPEPATTASTTAAAAAKAALPGPTPAAPATPRLAPWDNVPA